MSEVKVKKVNKMKIAVVSLACALVLAIGGMIGIYAASQQSVGASFTVNYSVGDNVAIAVGATIRRTYAGEYEWFEQSGDLDQNEHGLYIINATEQNDNNLQLTKGNFDLEIIESQPNLAFVSFYFESIGEGTIQASVTDNSQIKNMSVQYYVGELDFPEGPSQEEVLEALGFAHYSLLPVDPVNDAFTLDGNKSHSFIIEEGKIVVLTMVMVVESENKSAHYISEGDTGISFSFTKVEEN